MKVEKIKIEKEIIDLDKEKYDQGLIYKGWIIQGIKDTYNQEKLFLIEEDERGTFSDLIKITHSVLNGKIEKAVKEKTRWLISTVEGERERIKSLPFWKRLLNRF